MKLIFINKFLFKALEKHGKKVDTDKHPLTLSSRRRHLGLPISLQFITFWLVLFILCQDYYRTDSEGQRAFVTSQTPLQSHNNQ